VQQSSHSPRAHKVAVPSFFHCLAPLFRPLPAVFVRPLTRLCRERLSPRTGSVRDGPVDTAQRHPLMCRFSRRGAAVSLASLPGTPSSSPAVVAGGPCACFPVFAYLIATLFLSLGFAPLRFAPLPPSIATGNHFANPPNGVYWRPPCASRRRMACMRWTVQECQYTGKVSKRTLVPVRSTGISGRQRESVMILLMSTRSR
jgi:hypothetical protein